MDELLIGAAGFVGVTGAAYFAYWQRGTIENLARKLTGRRQNKYVFLLDSPEGTYHEPPKFWQYIAIHDGVESSDGKYKLDEDTLDSIIKKSGLKQISSRENEQDGVVVRASSLSDASTTLKYQAACVHRSVSNVFGVDVFLKFSYRSSGSLDDLLKSVSPVLKKLSQ
ncbi:MAG: hypothetical protein AABX51_01745 [Nanoarchaeota archaeon]